MKTIPLIISAVMILSISIMVVMSAPGDQYLNLTLEFQRSENMTPASRLMFVLPINF